MNLPEALRRRARMVAQVRAFFDARAFVEVETAVRLAAPAPEAHIDCPCVPPQAPSAGGRPGAAATYLRASPELQMKKLLAAGLDRIYQIGPCFREGEFGARHNPEFTMIEWYRRGETYAAIADDLRALLSALSPEPLAFRTVRVRDAYRREAGWDPWTGWDADRFDYDMATVIEPSLGTGPVFLADYPPQAAALARIRDGVAERWEFYWKGVELANCFTELCDGPEQRRRFAEAKALRSALGESDYPLDDEFLEMLPLIGSAAGVALGVDRLAMLLCGASTLAEVRAPV